MLKRRLGGVAAAARRQGRRLRARRGRGRPALDARKAATTFFVAQLGEALALRAALGREAGNPGAERHPARRRRCLRRSRCRPGAEQPRADRGLARCRQARRPQARRRRCRSTAACRGSACRPPMSSGSPTKPDAFDGIAVRLVMSHLACADEPQHPANEAQLAAFEASATRCCRRRRHRSPIRRASFSATPIISTWRGRARRSTASTRCRDGPTRCGRWCGLSAKIIQTRELPAPASATAMPITRSQPMRTATISLGYADGWPRRAVSRGLARTASGFPSSAASRWTASSSTSRLCRRAA